MIRVGRHNEPHAQYIGRGSPLGNPFIIGRDGDRAEVIAKYERWFYNQLLSNHSMRRELRRLASLADRGDLVLGCFCAPQSCHGDIIKAYLEANPFDPSKD